MAYNLLLAKTFVQFDPSTSVKQDFPYPSSIMYYIKTCVKSYASYKILIRVCKYFYSPTHPIPFFFCNSSHHLNNGQKFIMRFFGRHYIVALNDIKKVDKIWLIGFLNVGQPTLPLQYYSFLLKRVYQSDIYVLNICKQDVSFNDFKLLISSKMLATLIIVGGASIRDETDDTAIPLDKILQCVPNIQSFIFDFPEAGTQEYLKKILALLNVEKLQYFVLLNIIKPFDFDTFSAFIKMNQKIRFELYFSDEYPLQNEYTQKLQSFVDETIATGETENPPPLITFPGLSRDKLTALRVLIRKYKSR